LPFRIDFESNWKGFFLVLLHEKLSFFLFFYMPLLG